MGIANKEDGRRFSLGMRKTTLLVESMDTDSELGGWEGIMNGTRKTTLL